MTSLSQTAFAADQRHFRHPYLPPQPLPTAPLARLPPIEPHAHVSVPGMNHFKKIDHPALNDPGKRSRTPEASETGEKPQARQFIRPRFLT